LKSGFLKPSVIPHSWPAPQLGIPVCFSKLLNSLSTYLTISCHDSIPDFMRSGQNLATFCFLSYGLFFCTPHLFHLHFKCPLELGQPNFGPVCQYATFIFTRLQAFYQGSTLCNIQESFYCTQHFSKSSETKSAAAIGSVKVRYISFVKPQSRNNLQMFPQRKNVGSLPHRT